MDCSFPLSNIIKFWFIIAYLPPPYKEKLPPLAKYVPVCYAEKKGAALPPGPEGRGFPMKRYRTTADRLLAGGALLTGAAYLLIFFSAFSSLPLHIPTARTSCSCWASIRSPCSCWQLLLWPHGKSRAALRPSAAGDAPPCPALCRPVRLPDHGVVSGRALGRRPRCWVSLWAGRPGWPAAVLTAGSGNLYRSGIRKKGLCP